ncbi:MAG: biliverdin-producing heme oxygenase [Pseudomonadota bacterium]
MKATKEGLRWTLRAETEVAHQRLDDFISQVDIATRHGLSCYLLGNAGAHRALQPFDDAFAGHIDRRLTVLAADAREIGLALPAAGPALAPLDWDEAVGYRYVLAGSAMGSRLLARRHGRATDPDVRRAHRFVGDDALMALWRDVQLELDALPDHGPQAMAAVRGANACFTLFSRCFERAFADLTAAVNVSA